jgi:hypothetical protein
VHGKAWLAPLLGGDGDELVSVHIRVREADVVFVKGVLEASEGLTAVLAEPRPSVAEKSGTGRAGGSECGAAACGYSYDGGALVLTAPRSRLTELVETIRDLADELRARGAPLWWDENRERSE